MFCLCSLLSVFRSSGTTAWKVLVGTDFFTVEVLTLKGLVTYYVLFFIHPGSRRVSLAART